MEKHKENIHDHFNIKQSIIILINKIVLIEVIVVLLHLLIRRSLLYFWIHNNTIFGINVESFELILFHSITVIAILIIVIKWISYYYVITDKEIFIYKWIINKQKISYDINGIQWIRTKQNIIWRIFWYGTIKIENPLMKETIIIKNIQNPDYCVEKIKEERSKIKEEYTTNTITPLP